MKRIQKWFANERGAVTVFVAAAMSVLLGITALTVDAGFLYSRRRNLQNAADAAALAAVHEIFNDSSLIPELTHEKA